VNVSLAKQPLEYKVGSSNPGAEPLSYSQLDKRHETPVRARPFLIWMYSEAAVGLLSIEQDASPWSVRDQLPSLRNFRRLPRLVENVGECEVAD
jgi:hypothetical protein